ncbi:HDOD domain-containing protein [Idiomarina sp. UBA4520]|uniref:HDOD domain-containing protein n=1 Tax=Idiomarina sp. UBA4520 TaxID=1946647 RepID=UPI000AE99799|nr:HDOD domain-containing protein [Idiomarina sp. UBA4520]MBF39931.1 phosphohydrolase [Idiomarinaceae bacterium]|tara:strand:- start:18837 stop:20009 length:1173 start_codon:yes stop_codon:yes gene_type:complete
MFHFFSNTTEGGSKDPALRLEKRFINYLISFPFARKARSKADGVEDEEKEQRRKLLEVERLNYEERDRKAQARQRFSDRVSEELHEEIYHRALETIEDGDYVRERLIPLPEKLPELLDTLSLKAASMRRIESLVQGMDWFHTGLLRTVNQPPFIDRNKQVKLDNLRVAMSFVGTENLRLLAPAYIMQNWLPPSTHPFTLFRRKVWEHSLGTAIAAHNIAVERKLKDPILAYTMGMFHELGKIALTKLYLKLFDEVQREFAMASVNDKSPERHNALVQLTPDEHFLRDLMLEKDKEVSYLVAEGWGLKRVPVSKHLLAFTQANRTTPKYDSDYAEVLAQANAYCEFRMMREVDLASLEEGKRILNKYSVSAETVARLNNVSLKRPPIIVPD